MFCWWKYIVLIKDFFVELNPVQLKSQLSRTISFIPWHSAAMIQVYHNKSQCQCVQSNLFTVDRSGEPPNPMLQPPAPADPINTSNLPSDLRPSRLAPYRESQPDRGRLEMIESRQVYFINKNCIKLYES